MAIRRRKLVRMARPSSSTVRRRLPREVRSSRAMFLRWAKGRVQDLLLGKNFSQRCRIKVKEKPKSRQKTYFTRSKTVTLLPTGESKQVPSGVKRRFPLR